MPVLATYFSVRRGRDPFFKFFMKTLFPRQVRELPPTGQLDPLTGVDLPGSNVLRVPETDRDVVPSVGILGLACPLGTPPHPTIQDNGQYHTTASDFRLDIRYNAFSTHTTVVTPCHDDGASDASHVAWPS